MTLFEKLLDYYHITKEDYEELVKPHTFLDFNDGHEFDNVVEAVNLTYKMMEKKAKTIIYGDYDCDGIMGVSILKKMFDYLSFPVDYYVPSRYLDGYGININKAKEYVNSGYQFVITVDNGVCANEAIDYLKDNNVTVLVIDHHTPGEVLPRADVILHPLVSHLGNTTSSGAFSAFMFSRKLLDRVDKYLATMAAISLVSDMMPLKEYNRNLLRVVIDTYQKDEFLPISLLAGDKPFNENTIGMYISPKINSIGRVIENSSINEMIKYFTSDDKAFVLSYFNYIVEVSEQRKALSNNAANSLLDKQYDASIVEYLDIKEGIMGIVANNLLNRYNKPTIIFTKGSEPGVLKGSARSQEGFNISEAFHTLDQYLISGGGHANAGGCAIKEENFELFKEKFNELVKNTDIQVKEKEIIPLRLIDISRSNLKLVQSFSPFGIEWNAPTFMIEHIDTSALSYSRNQLHIITNIGGGSMLRGFNFSREEVSKNKFINIYGQLSEDSYRDLIQTVFDIRKIEKYS
ncbi:MAG: hypothetical protein E7181_03715 [Erysipelotrichaceae bacterium]|nr:hypothetical protein [Erysipelotrichaceae bacterium]